MHNASKELWKESGDPMFRDEIVERRSQLRIEGSIPATVSGMDTSGEPFEIGTALGNLSLSGLYVCLERPIAVDSPLSAIIRFEGLEVKTTGVVKRVEPQPDGSFGLGVAFDSYNIFSIR